MKINTEDNQIYASAGSSDLFSSFGGEYHEDGLSIVDYGLNLGDISINQISANQYKSLAIEMINHLLINGYRFELKDDKDGNGEYIQETK